MALYHKWGVKTGLTFALQFFMLITDGLNGVKQDLITKIMCSSDGFTNFEEV